MNPIGDFSSEKLADELRYVDKDFFKSPNLSPDDLKFIFDILSVSKEIKEDPGSLAQTKKISVLLANYNTKKLPTSNWMNRATSWVRSFLPNSSPAEKPAENQRLVERIIEKRTNPDLPPELIFRILGEAAQPFKPIFKELEVGKAVEGREQIESQDIEVREGHKAIHNTAYWSQIAKQAGIRIPEELKVPVQEFVKNTLISRCEKLKERIGNLPPKINEILKKEPMPESDILYLAKWKEGRDDVVVLRILDGGNRKASIDDNADYAIEEGRGKPFNDSFEAWRKKGRELDGVQFSFCGLSTLPEQLIDFLSSPAMKGPLSLDYNNLEYLPESFSAVARSEIYLLSLANNNLQELPVWMEDFKNLSSLDLRGNPALSKASIEELQKKLPNCTISYDL